MTDELKKVTLVDYTDRLHPLIGDPGGSIDYYEDTLFDVELSAADSVGIRCPVCANMFTITREVKVSGGTTQELTWNGYQSNQSITCPYCVYTGYIITPRRQKIF